MTVLEQATLSTDCTCEYDETTDYYCIGDCYEFACERVDEILNEWDSRNGVSAQDLAVRIDGSRMGWTGSSGYFITHDIDTIPAILKINGDYRLVFTLDGETLRVIRYSHDEPTGASFTVRATPGDEY